MTDDHERKYQQRMMAAAGAVRVAAILAAIWLATQIVEWVVRIVLQFR